MRGITFVAAFLCLIAAVVCADYSIPPANPLNDPDLPNWNGTGSIETLPACSIIIPMGDLQRTGGNFNLAAYGLINHLLWSNVPVKWIVKSGKGPDEADFSAFAWELYPSAESTATLPPSRSFNGGAFVIPTHLTHVGYNISMQYVHRETDVNETADVELVKFYRLAAPVEVEVRYSITRKPFVAVLDSSGARTVQMAVLDAAGFIYNQHYKVMNYEEANNISASTCISLATEPHFEEPNPAARTFVAGMRTFIESGGNFLFQCGGISTYEQCHQDRSSLPSEEACPDGFALTHGGLNINKQKIKHSAAGVNLAADSPYLQYTGSWAAQGGSVSAMDIWDLTKDGYNTSLRWENNAYFGVGAADDSRPAGYVYYAAHAKLASFHTHLGGNVFYLTGHEYTSDNHPGRRLYLNAALFMANRTGCVATVNLPDGTVKVIGELTIDLCAFGGPGCDYFVKKRGVSVVDKRAAFDLAYPLPGVEPGRVPCDCQFSAGTGISYTYWDACRTCNGTADSIEDMQEQCPELVIIQPATAGGGAPGEETIPASLIPSDIPNNGGILTGDYDQPDAPAPGPSSSSSSAPSPSTAPSTSSVVPTGAASETPSSVAPSTGSTPSPSPVDIDDPSNSGQHTIKDTQVYYLVAGENVDNLALYISILSMNPTDKLTIYLKKGSPADVAGDSYDCGPITIHNSLGDFAFDFQENKGELCPNLPEDPEYLKGTWYISVVPETENDGVTFTLEVELEEKPSSADSSSPSSASVSQHTSIAAALLAIVALFALVAL